MKLKDGLTIFYAYKNNQMGAIWMNEKLKAIFNLPELKDRAHIPTDEFQALIMKKITTNLTDMYFLIKMAKVEKLIKTDRKKITLCPDQIDKFLKG